MKHRTKRLQTYQPSPFFVGHGSPQNVFLFVHDAVKHNAATQSYRRGQMGDYPQALRVQKGAPVQWGVAHSRSKYCEVFVNPRLELNLLNNSS